eukprot:INCI9411.1.p1 GENE.INCI9411.1~~INCI9411.1.p1  ORF type:complete len:273 (+),score=35.48 INCI9411.1:96-914(+)
MKTAFDLTFVEYEEGDLVGQVCALFSLAPVFAIVAYVAVVLARREFITIAALVGQLANVALNVVIKNYLNQPRPATTSLSGPGMPSNHSQFVFFTTAFWALHAYNRKWVQFSPQAPLAGHLYRHAIVFVLIVAAMIVAFSRVYLEYHFASQVVVGAGLGLVLGIAWYIVVSLQLRPLFQKYENCKLFRFFYVRDSSNVPNILGLEHEITQQHAQNNGNRSTRNRQRQLATERSSENSAGLLVAVHHRKGTRTAKSARKKTRRGGKKKKSRRK